MAAISIGVGLAGLVWTLHHHVVHESKSRDRARQWIARHGGTIPHDTHEWFTLSSARKPSHAHTHTPPMIMDREYTQLEQPLPPLGVIELADFRTKAPISSADYTFTPPPKILWTHWDSRESMTKLVELNLAHTRSVLAPAGWDVRFLTNADFLRLCPYPSHGFFAQDATHKADYIRLWLVREFGGLWADASVIFNDGAALNDFYDKAVAEQAEFAGFACGKRWKEGEFSAKNMGIENFCFMAPINSPLIKEWLLEYTDAMDLGFNAYRGLVRQLGVVMPYWHLRTYFAAYQALQTTLALRRRRGDMPRLFLLHVEDSMYKIGSNCGLVSPLCVWREFRSHLNRSLPFIKLHSANRLFFPLEFFHEYDTRAAAASEQEPRRLENIKV